MKLLPYQLVFIASLVVLDSATQDTNTVLYRSSNALPTPASHALHDFAFEMFQKLLEFPPLKSNIIFSPLSVYSIFTALLPGLDGTSLEEVKRLLRADYLSNVTVEETKMTTEIFNDTNYPYTMEHTQRLFIDRRFRLRKPFKRLAEGYHKALIKKLDFQSSPEISRNKINNYVARKTREDVPSIMEENSVNENTKLVLVNTIYVEAKWKSPFPKTSTSTRYFNVSPRERIEIPFMFNKDGLCSKPLHSDELNSDVYVIPFEGSALMMVVFMPNIAGDFRAFEEIGVTNNVQEVLERLWSRNRPNMHSCRLLMPKFAIHHKVTNMKSVLNAMSIHDLFIEGAADLSRLTSSDRLHVSDVQHATAIKATEEGVQVSSAAAISTLWKAVPYTVNLTKPFVFLIRHETTGSVLFLGKITRPSLSEPENNPNLAN